MLTQIFNRISAPPQSNHAHSMTIGKLAELTNCNVPTIRYYEEIGLLPAARRRASGHRVYGEATVDQLFFIRQCRELGFSLDYVRELMQLASDGEKGCQGVKNIASMRLEVVRNKIAEMQALEMSLLKVIQSCDQSCCGGPARDCAIFKEIHNHRVDASDFNGECACA